MTVRFGIIGTGFISNRLAEALGRTTGAKLHSVCSRKLGTAEAFATKHGVSRQNCTDSLDDFLGDRYMDAVYIGTPPFLHADQADAAAAAGKHVLVEKPMALSVAECHRMREACAQAGVTLGLGYQNRQHPLHQRAREWVRLGRIGEVVEARARWFLRYENPPPEWRQKKDTAGWWALGDVGVHCIDLLRWILGEVCQVTAVLRRDPELGYETEDTAVLFLRHEGGASSLVEVCTVSPSPSTELEIVGTKGWIHARQSIGMDGEGELVRCIEGGKEEELTDWSPPAPLYVEELRDFLLAIREKREPIATAEDGLRGIEILEAAERSAAEGGSIDL